jgi:hypothetical protein
MRSSLPLALLPALAVFTAASAPPAAPASSLLLRETGERSLEFLIQDSLFLRVKLGRRVERLPDLSLGHSRARAAEAASLRELREKAKKALGARFDVRRFHDAVLGSGSLPLTTLERHVDWFVAEEKARSAR